MPEEQFCLKIKLTCKSDLHIAGPGRTLPLVDRSVEVDEHGRPIIPASSFRGRVRAQVERTLNAFGEETCVAPRPYRMCPHAPLEKRPANHEPPYYCRACRIFGSAWRLSSITVTDLAAGAPFDVDLASNQDSSERKKKGHLSLRTGVAINRRLGAAEEQRLFVIETVPFQLADNSLCFSGTVEGWLERRDVGWLLAGINSLTHIGSGKARGLGRIQSIELDLQVYNVAAREWQPVAWENVRKEAFRAQCDSE